MNNKKKKHPYIYSHNLVNPSLEIFSKNKNKKLKNKKIKIYPSEHSNFFFFFLFALSILHQLLYRLVHVHNIAVVKLYLTTRHISFLCYWKVKKKKCLFLLLPRSVVGQTPRITLPTRVGGGCPLLPPWPDLWHCPLLPEVKSDTQLTLCRVHYRRPLKVAQVRVFSRKTKINK